MRFPPAALIIGLFLISCALIAQTPPSTTSFPATLSAAPRAITPGPDGNLWFTEANNNIGRITPAGSVKEFQAAPSGWSLAGITTGPDGALWYLAYSAGFTKIARMTTAGTYTDYTIVNTSDEFAQITAGPDGALWFTEESANKIGQITTSGTITEFPVPTQMSRPVAITKGMDGALWFTEENANKIGRISTGGAFSEFAITTTGSVPRGIATGPDGVLWFTEFMTGKIGRVSFAGAVTEYSLPSATAGPLGISLATDGALWVVENNSNQFARITSSGAVTEFPAFSSPKSIASGPDGALWLTQATRIGRAYPAPTFTEYAVPTSGSQPNRITSGPDGALWFTEYHASKIARVATDGSMTEFPLSANSAPLGIVTGPDSALWFAESAGNNIGRFDPIQQHLNEYPIPTAASTPSLIAPGPDSALWFTESTGNKIGRINGVGFVNEYAVPTANSYPLGIAPCPAVAPNVLCFTEYQGGAIGVAGPGGVSGTVAGATQPVELRVGGDGGEWWTEQSSNTIRRLYTTSLYSVPTPASQPIGIANGPDDGIWFTELAGNKIGRVTLGGVADDFPVPTLNAAPMGISSGPDGALWFTEFNANKIGRAAPACSYSVNPSAMTVSGVAGTASIGILAAPGCPWFASTTADWITITQFSGIGNGKVMFSFPSLSRLDFPRSATILVGSKMVTVSQNPGRPVFAITKTHTGNFAINQQGTYTVTVSNAGDLPPQDTGVTEMPPAGMSIVSMTGDGWSCSSVSCSRSDTLAPGTSFPPITVTVQVAANVHSPLTNVVTVTEGYVGGAGNIASDVTTINGAPTNPPFGAFDTPINNSTNVVGAIAVTGWALDTVGVSKVEIYRDPVSGETGGTFGLVFIGTGTFVGGARPDVKALYGAYPNADRAGWGYQLLSNFLPNGGNGTFKLHAFAYNMFGQVTELPVAKTITCANNSAGKPFGTIDTPSQGGTASGAGFLNFGWALTPPPGGPFQIPTDGSTITLYVDGAPQTGRAVYNQFRSDIATLFPGYTNSSGPVGYFVLDTTRFTNGLHTIAWVVNDNAARAEGIGSRYFTIANGPASTRVPRIVEHSRTPKRADVANGSVVTTQHMDRLELHLGAVHDGHLVAAGEREDLPAGSTLDPETGIFYWQVLPPYLGAYNLEFAPDDGSAPPLRIQVRVEPQRF